MSHPGVPSIAHPRPRALASAFLAVAMLTGLEIVVAGLAAGRSARIAALVALLVAKVALVMTSFMRVPVYRRWAGLALTAIVAAVGFAVVLMLDTAVRVGVR